MKLILLMCYTISVAYCYFQLSYFVDKCIDVFQERHPLLPVSDLKDHAGIKNALQLLMYSSIPVLNIAFGYFLGSADDDLLNRIIGNVEDEHSDEIKMLEAMSRVEE